VGLGFVSATPLVEFPSYFGWGAAPPRIAFMVLGAVSILIGCVVWANQNRKLLREYSAFALVGGFLIACLPRVPGELAADRYGAVFFLTGLAGIVLSFLMPGRRRFPATVPRAPETNKCVSRNEPWRNAPTGFRFIERLKEQLVSLEDSFISLHATRSWLTLELEKSRRDNSVYDGSWLAQQLEWSAGAVLDGEIRIAKLKERIEKILAGRVQDEITQLEVDIAKLERECREMQTDMQAALEARRQTLRARLKELEVQLIELRADKNELELFRSQQLTQPAKSQDEEQFDRYRLKRFLDGLGEVVELEHATDTDVEIRRTYKKLRSKIENDPDLTPRDQKELLSRLEERYAEKAKARGFSIYEEDM